MAEKKLPKTIYVVWDQAPNDENSYLLAAESWDEHCQLAKRKTVGTYQLVEVSDVVAESKKLPRKR
jgi:type IV secretory pathway TrbF-like protein